MVNRFQVLGVSLLFANSALINAAPSGELDCMVKPEMYVELSSPVDGVLDSLLVETSSSVKKGQVVAQLESSVEAARVKLAQQEALVEHAHTAKQIELEFTERNKKRYKDMYDKESVAYYEADRANTDVALAKVAVDKSVAEKKSAALQLQLAQAQLEQKTIKSPINGIVVERYVMPGESVNGRPIMKLAQVNPLRVELVAPASLFGQVRRGMSVDIKPEKPANQHYRATVTSVDQLIDPASGSFKVRLSLPNPDDKLVAGVNCTANLHIGQLETSANDQSTSSTLPKQTVSLTAPSPAQALKVTPAAATAPLEQPKSVNLTNAATGINNRALNSHAIQHAANCIELGPFASPASLQAMLKPYAQDKQLIGVDNKAQEVLTGYMVFFPAANTHEKSIETYARLKKQLGKGIRLFDKGPLLDGISLGFSADEAEAQKMAAAFTKAGLTVQIRPQHKSSTAYYARLQGVSPQQITAQQLQMPTAKDAPVLSVQSVECQPAPAI